MPPAIAAALGLGGGATAAGAGAGAAGTGAALGAGGASLAAGTAPGVFGGLAAPASGAAALAPHLSLLSPAASPFTNFSLVGPATTGGLPTGAALTTSPLGQIMQTIKQFGQGLGQGTLGVPEHPLPAFTKGAQVGKTALAPSSKHDTGPAQFQAAEAQIQASMQSRLHLLQSLGLF